MGLSQRRAATKGRPTTMYGVYICWVMKSNHFMLCQLSPERQVGGVVFFLVAVVQASRRQLRLVLRTHLGKEQGTQGLQVMARPRQLRQPV